MVRTLGFRPKNKGSIPFNLEIIFFKLKFLSFLNLKLKSFFKIKKSTQIVTSIFLIMLNIFYFLSNLVSIYYLKKYKTFYWNFYIKKQYIRFLTIQRAPIAHRQWSQEQYHVRVFYFFLKTSFPFSLEIYHLLNYKTLPVCLFFLNKAALKLSTNLLLNINSEVNVGYKFLLAY